MIKRPRRRWQKKKGAKTSLRILKDKYGMRRILQAAQGEFPDKMSKDDVELVK
jgi:hypothetical protein